MCHVGIVLCGGGRPAFGGFARFSSGSAASFSFLSVGMGLKALSSVTRSESGTGPLRPFGRSWKKFPALGVCASNGWLEGARTGLELELAFDPPGTNGLDAALGTKDFVGSNLCAVVGLAMLLWCARISGMGPG